MAEIKLTFDLTFTRRFLSRAGAVAIMLCAVPELDSESVTLSTYYPAPSGVYTNMITTGNTYLARDGGRYINATTGSALAIGVTVPEVNSKLTVSNGSIGGFYGLTPRYTNWNAYGTGDGGAAIYNSNEGAYQALMLVGNNSGGGVRRVKVWDEMTVNGNQFTTGSMSVTGPVRSGQGPAGCSAPVQYSYGSPSGGNVALCGGQYITTIAGFYTKYLALPVDRSAMVAPPVNNSFTYMCCNCPSTGCDL